MQLVRNNPDYVRHRTLCGCILNDIRGISCSTWIHDIITEHWIDCDCGNCGPKSICQCPIHTPQSDDSEPWGDLVESGDNFEIRRDAASGYTVHTGNEIIFATGLDDAREAVCEIPKNAPSVAPSVAPAGVAESKTHAPDNSTVILESFTSSDGTLVVRLYHDTSEHEFKLEIYSNNTPEFIGYFPDDNREIAYHWFNVNARDILESDDEDECDEPDSDTAFDGVVEFQLPDFTPEEAARRIELLAQPANPHQMDVNRELMDA